MKTIVYLDPLPIKYPGCSQPQHKPAEKVLARYYGGEPTFYVLPSLLSSWETNELDDWRDLSVSAVEPPRMLRSVKEGATDGDRSLAISATGDGLQWIARHTWAFQGSEGFVLFQQAAANPESYMLEFDVFYDDEHLPEDFSSAAIWVAVASDGGNSVHGPFAAIDENKDSVFEVTLPLSDVASALDAASLFYEVKIGQRKRGSRTRYDTANRSRHDCLGNCRAYDEVSAVCKHPR